MLAEFNDLSTS